MLNFRPAVEDKAFAASNNDDRKLDDDLFAPKKHNSVIIAKSKPLEPVYAYRAEDGKLYRIEFSGNREEADCNGPVSYLLNYTKIINKVFNIFIF